MASCVCSGNRGVRFGIIFPFLSLSELPIWDRGGSDDLEGLTCCQLSQMDLFGYPLAFEPCGSKLAVESCLVKL